MQFALYVLHASGRNRFSPKASLMTAEEIFGHWHKSFVENGVDKIRLTGGEPLLRKDFPEIISKLSTLGFHFL